MDVRAHVLEYLATPDADTRFARAYLVTQVANRAFCRPDQVYEALWGLVGEGLAYLDPAGQSSGTDNWRWRLSGAGASVASAGAWEPRDPEGYLRRLRAYRPEIDPVAVGYVEEALRAFNARCYLATSVMLGVASERVVGGLARAVVEAVPNATKLRAAVENPKVTQFSRFQELRKQLEPMRPELPDDLGDTLTMDAVADLLRITRNEAGHPTGRQVDEDTAYTHLQMAARYLQKITMLNAHFRDRTES
ncbi:MAG TPA: hypothetical protein VK988_15240 [Acidimicrobiales bacterium]|nr:hypothetical protein [Acidimicrobiales bacterium]